MGPDGGDGEHRATDGVLQRNGAPKALKLSGDSDCNFCTGKTQKYF